MMRSPAILFCMLLGAVLPDVHGATSVSIRIHLSSYPQLVRVPGYPVYYAPGLGYNYFFYDGMYWMYLDDAWYTSSWYNGPWFMVAPDFVPLFVLRIPVRYYLAPPPYFLVWQRDAPPRWHEHWGGKWAQHHRGWDRWNRHAVPAPAPLPVYQRRYTEPNYPRPEQQRQIQGSQYRYRPHDPVVRQHVQAAAPVHEARERRAMPAPKAVHESREPREQRVMPPPQPVRERGEPRAMPAPPPMMARPEARQAPPAREATGHGHQGKGQGKERGHDDGEDSGPKHDKGKR